ncbi:hypothetical protein [Nostoc sp.]|uniref:hypothetical protein n=1 Tax=Nostoc sp. TaxID=1180 RepID=UPI002FF5460E
MPDSPNEDLQLLLSYQREIEGILQELRTISGLPQSLIQRLNTLQTRILWDIQQHIETEPIPAPTESIDF